MTINFLEECSFEEININGYEKVVKITNNHTNLKAFIAIHDTTLGPSLGGVRIYPYQNEYQALNDVLRLAKGMTYKSALANVSFGGAKSVIICEQKNKTPELLKSFAHAVNLLEGRYICAEDVGCSVDDVKVMQSVTKYVVGLPHEKSSGNPSFYTAWGTFKGIQSVLYKLYGSNSLEGKKIALQGIGSVGLILLDQLFWHGANVTIADVDQAKVDKICKKYNVKSTSVEEIVFLDCDVFVPCALGGVINDETISKLKCKAIAGCANNQLLTEEHGDILHSKKILYAPDFVINAGGLINVAFELEEEGYNPAKSRKKANDIYDVLMSIYEIAEKNNISTNKAALDLANYRIKYQLGKQNKPLFFHHSL